MDNLGTGGNRGNMDGKSPEVFDGEERKIEDSQSREKLDLSGEAKTELGGIVTEMFGTPEVPKDFEASEGSMNYESSDSTKDMEEVSNTESIPDFPEMTPPEMVPPEINALQGARMLDTEYKPLAEDGSTEGKIDKDKILTFGGDLIDKESQKQVEKALSKYKNDPFELDNIRNEMMADGLRDNYGRIFGNDNSADDAPEKQQMETMTSPENSQAEVIDFSDMAEGKVA